MRQLFLQQGALRMSEAQFSIAELPIFPPARNQVLIKVEAAAVNPSDYGACRAVGGEPRVVGNECSGTVVAVGGGISTIGLLGREVFCLAMSSGRGAYAEFACAEAGMTWTVPSGVAVEDACGFFVNPFTAYAILEEAKARKQKYLIHTAAASVLGQMLAKASRIYGVTVVHIVRRQEQAALLRDLGEKHVLVHKGGDMETDDPDFWAALRKLIQDHSISIAFDALAGAMPGLLSAALPPRSTVFVYGRLASNFVDGLPATDMIYEDKQVTGFLVMTSLARRGAFAFSKAGRFVRRHFVDCFLPPSFQDVKLEDTAALLKKIDPHGAKPMGVTGRKWRVRPWAK